MSYWNSLPIDDLVGKVFTEVRNINDDSIVMTVSDTEGYILYHSQDCCEHVRIEEIHGDLSDLVGTPIVVAEERSEDEPDHWGSGEWTFYTFRTVKGDVTIRFYGESNGYYSTAVHLGRVN